MLRYMKEGFKSTLGQYFLLVALWLYQFFWGFVLLMFVKSIVVPLMHRYPGEHLPPTASQLFLAEGQFQLLKTDVSHTYLWLLLGFAAIRMLLTPLLNAGIYFSLHNSHLHSGYRFLKGIKELSRPFLLYYLLQMALTLAPLYWLYPIAKDAFLQHADYASLAARLLPWIFGYLAYGYAIHLVFVYVQLGRTVNANPAPSLWLLVRRFPQIAALALALLALAGAVTAAALSASLYWAGLSALVLHQLFHITKTIFKIWAIATQYHYFAHHRN